MQAPIGTVLMGIDALTENQALTDINLFYEPQDRGSQYDRQFYEHRGIFIESSSCWNLVDNTFWLQFVRFKWDSKVANFMVYCMVAFIHNTDI